jgi:hypothetical protein
MMKNPDRRKIYPDEGFIDQDESSLIIPMTLFKLKTFGANIYIIQNIIYNKYNSTFDEMWTMRLICLDCSYRHSYFNLEAKSLNRINSLG